MEKEKQCLIRQTQALYYSEEWSKLKAVKYVKCHLLELHLDKKKIRWKDSYGNSPALKQMNLLIWCGTKS